MITKLGFAATVGEALSLTITLPHDDQALFPATRGTRAARELTPQAHQRRPRSRSGGEIDRRSQQPGIDAPVGGHVEREGQPRPRAAPGRA